MKMKCVIASYLHGDIVKVGQVIDIGESEAESSRIKRSFVAVADETPATAPAAAGHSPAKAGAAIVAGLTRDQAIAKLRQAGVKFAGNIANDKLVTLYNTTFSNIGEAVQ